MAKVSYLSFVDVDNPPHVAPTNLRATNITSSTITIAYDAGADDITPVASLRYDREVDGVVVSRSTPGDLAMQRTGLDPNTDYTFRFRTVDELDQVGEWSESKTITTTVGTTSQAINPATEFSNSIAIPIVGGENAISDKLMLTADALNPDIRPNQIVLVGEQGNYSLSSTQNNRTYDARDATFTPNVNSNADSYVIKINTSTTKGARIAIIGGYVDTDVPLTQPWNWVKSNRDGTGIRFYGSDWLLVDGMRFYNVMDGWRPRGANAINVICSRNNWYDNIRDDGIENDEAGAPGGLCHDELYESCFMIQSCAQNHSWNGIEPMVMKRCLMHLKPMPYTENVGGNNPAFNTEYGDDNPRHGHSFKRHWDPDSYPIQLVDSVIFMEQHSVDANDAQGKNNDLLVNKSGSSATNTLLIWIGYQPSVFPGDYPAGITEINLLTTNPDTGLNYTEAELRQVFTDQANIWKTRHGYKSGASILSTYTDPATNILDAAKIIAPDDFQPFDATSYVG